VGSDEQRELEAGAEFLGAIEKQDDVSLTEADRAYFKVLDARFAFTPRYVTSSSSRALSGRRKGAVNRGHEVPVQVQREVVSRYGRARHSAETSHQTFPGPP